jgi:hypothetical protein
MLSYAQFSQLRYLLDGEHCSPAQVAQAMGLTLKTVQVWASRPDLMAGDRYGSIPVNTCQRDRPVAV